jgi:hypothetical protein
MPDKRARKSAKKPAAKKPAAKKTAKKPAKKPAARKPRAPRKRMLDPNDPHFIPGIFNYCDRWCERCEFSHRCHNFAENELYFGEDPEARDVTNPKFQKTLKRIYADAQKILDAALAKATTVPDPNAIEAAAAHEKHVERRARAIGQKETKLAITYAHMVDEWFNNELRLPLEHVQDLERRVETGEVSVATAKGDLVRLNDCVEVIRWYQHFIFVKLGRAFSSLVEEQERPEIAHEKDSDGTAKVALISMDRSIEAWSALSEMFPQKADSILEIQVVLSRLRTSLSAKFPEARKFIRPGFDEPR